MITEIKRKLKGIFNSQERRHDELRFLAGQAVIAGNRNSYKRRSSIWNYDTKVFSQFGEDGVLDYLLGLEGILKPSFVEIGTGDYSESNTRFLYQRTGGKGLIIDCDRELDRKVRRVLGDYYWKGWLTVKSAFVDADNIMSLLKGDGEDAKDGWLQSDVFSLDVDGIDYWLMKKIGESLNAGIVILEYNAYFGSELCVTVPYSPSFSRTSYHSSNLVWGASLRAYVEMMEGFGYFFVGSNLNCQNGFWLNNQRYGAVRDDLEVHDLDQYVNNCCRESRDAKGRLSLASPAERLRVMADAEVIDLRKNKLARVDEIYEMMSGG